jgi:4-alpha-glucanotransferase
MKARESRLLADLAGLWGVQGSYRNVAGRRVQASPDALLAALSTLGAPVDGFDDVPAAIRERRETMARRLVDPVAVAWDGRLALRLPAGIGGTVSVELESEDGTERSWKLQDVTRRRSRDGVAIREVRLPGRLPVGYHRARVSAAGRHGEAIVVASPRLAPPTARGWGVFLPLYALHGHRSWGVGDAGELGRLVRWASDLGAGVVATTPLDAAFLDEPFEPGPYSPASRLFWNELFLDVEGIPDLDAAPEARAVLDACRGDVRELRRQELVDHRRAMELKRRVLRALLAAFEETPSPRRDAFRSFVEAHPRLRDYALFRAALEKHRAPWASWPRTERDGAIHLGDVDREAYQYHLLAQWLVHEQLDGVHRDADRRGVALCLDLPLGCHPAGYDVWRERDRFALGATAGAPPDAFFSGGQDWGFPPPHPEGIREDGYRYLRECLRHVLSSARILRVDHIMAFHRLYWIPRGMDPRRGVYVRYRPEEMYAVLLLEAHRVGAPVVGEDLGTVPASVRRTMARHGIRRSFVLQTEINAGNGTAPPPPGVAASLNTHDMPTFATFREGGDIDLRVERGWLDPALAGGERERRAERLERVAAWLRQTGYLAGSDDGLTAAALTAMATSDAGLVMVGLEDLWAETEPQNVPGTTDGANWRRRTRYPLERFSRMSEVTDVLRSVDRARRAQRS